MVEKVVRDGKVAVLVSPGYGAGWSTWADAPEEALFSPDVVSWVEAGKPRDVLREKEDEWEAGFGYLGGLEDLQVEWVPEGSRFRIEEYDGFETLHILGPDWGYTA